MIAILFWIVDILDGAKPRRGYAARFTVPGACESWMNDLWWLLIYLMERSHGVATRPALRSQELVSPGWTMCGAMSTFIIFYWCDSFVENHFECNCAKENPLKTTVAFLYTHVSNHFLLWASVYEIVYKIDIVYHNQLRPLAEYVSDLQLSLSRFPYTLTVAIRTVHSLPLSNHHALLFLQLCCPSQVSLLEPVISYHRSEALNFPISYLNVVLWFLSLSMIWEGYLCLLLWMSVRCSTVFSIGLSQHLKGLNGPVK